MFCTPQRAARILSRARLEEVELVDATSPLLEDQAGGTTMPRKKRPTERWYRGRDIPMRVIRRFARQVADRFHPEKIVLFGSRAYGSPHDDSDVDLLVIMEARNEI